MLRSVLATLAAAALVAGSVQPAHAQPAGPAPTAGAPAAALAGQVVMVVADAALLTAPETKVKERLVETGFTVIEFDDSTVGPDDLTGAAFAILSSTVDSVVLGDRLLPVPVPLWVAKPYLFDEYGMTGSVAEVDYGTKDASKVKIAAPDHPLAAGHQGKVKIYAKAKNVSWGKPAASATVVAKVKKKATVFTIGQGATLVGGQAAAGCRLTFPIYQTAPLGFTTAGWELFDAAAAWAAAGCE